MAWKLCSDDEIRKSWSGCLVECVSRVLGNFRRRQLDPLSVGEAEKGDEVGVDNVLAYPAFLDFEFYFRACDVRVRKICRNYFNITVNFRGRIARRSV